MHRESEPLGARRDKSSSGAIAEITETRKHVSDRSWLKKWKSQHVWSSYDWRNQMLLCSAQTSIPQVIKRLGPTPGARLTQNSLHSKALFSKNLEKGIAGLLVRNNTLRERNGAISFSAVTSYAFPSPSMALVLLWCILQVSHLSCKEIESHRHRAAELGPQHRSWGPRNVYLTTLPLCFLLFGHLTWNMATTGHLLHLCSRD